MALHYQLKVKGVLDDTWSEWFDGMTITHDVAGNTLLEGAVRNQTALYGLIAKARDLHLTLIAVEQRTTSVSSPRCASVRCSSGWPSFDRARSGSASLPI